MGSDLSCGIIPYRIIPVISCVNAFFWYPNLVCGLFFVWVLRSEFLVKIGWVTLDQCDMASLVPGKFVHGIVSFKITALNICKNNGTTNIC